MEARLRVAQFGTGAVAALLMAGALAGCGTGEGRALRVEANRPQTSETSQKSANAVASAEEIKAFATIVAESPGWARVRRIGPPTRDWLDESHGLLVGRVVGVEPGLTEKAEISTPDGAMTAVMDRVCADLIITVEQSAGVKVTPGDRVAIPIGIWFAGTGADHMVGVTAKTTDDLAARAPVGNRVAVYVSDVVADGGQYRAEMAVSADLPSPSAVVFEASSGSLVSLDWMIGSSADEYFGAPTMDSLVEQAASLDG